MGHANISITLDRYGHLMPGNEAEARALLDAYLDREGANRPHGRPHAAQKLPLSRAFGAVGSGILPGLESAS
jgi:hypothetical protein